MTLASPATSSAVNLFSRTEHQRLCKTGTWIIDLTKAQLPNGENETTPTALPEMHQPWEPNWSEISGTWETPLPNNSRTRNSSQNDVIFEDFKGIFKGAFWPFRAIFGPFLSNFDDVKMVKFALFPAKNWHDFAQDNVRNFGGNYRQRTAVLKSSIVQQLCCRAVHCTAPLQFGAPESVVVSDWPACLNSSGSLFKVRLTDSPPPICNSDWATVWRALRTTILRSSPHHIFGTKRREIPP